MSAKQRLRITQELLEQLQHQLRLSGLWSEQSPSEDALHSTVPFAYDVMPLNQWLQFIFIPKMQQLIDMEQPLPSEIALTPMAEHQSNQYPDLVQLLPVLRALDDHLSDSEQAHMETELLEIVYQDEYLVVINKPAGLLVHRSMIDRHETRFAMQMLRDQIGQYVFPVHRLDRPTSGLLVFALSSEVASKMTEIFTAGQVSKTYYAIVRGYAPEQLHIDYALKEKLDKIADKKARQDKPAQQAQTELRCLYQVELPYAVGRYNSARYSLVELTPKTGRKHQLRRHMAHIRHPIVGDTTHGDGKQNQFIKQQFGFQGLALTCKKLTFAHPVSGKSLVVECGFDARMTDLLNQWGWQNNL
jgi:tRNA pseudouridine65 synthase